MDDWAFVLIEYNLAGCKATFDIRGVTTDPVYASEWRRAPADEFTRRELKEVPFFPKIP